jgi:ribosome-binding ATPase
LAAVEKALHRVNKTARSGDKEAIKQVAILEKCQAALNDAQPVRTIDFSKEERAQLQAVFLHHRQARHVCGQRVGRRL